MDVVYNRKSSIVSRKKAKEISQKRDLKNVVKNILKGFKAWVMRIKEVSDNDEKLETLEEIVK